ncbi:DUF692 domain-containing protein [Aquabacterium sp. UBA2148]|uniref:DUF692 domain-containing protein n=1 Tax=Aquabacterium sp. UBA2148 TaxID=1946042 RepID=UPI0025798EAE|nr:DUF692 domain-containing protein [Aquabacterium sp. UBA2148]
MEMAAEEQIAHAGVVATAMHGCGLRFAHLPDWMAHQRPPCLLELHTENLFALPSVAHRRLSALREHHAFSLHGVGLSLGSTDGLDPHHLQQVAEQVRRYEPLLVSEHLAWNRIDGTCVPDLLPMPFSLDALHAVAANVQRTQEALQRSIAVENISAYLMPPPADFDEAGFLTELTQRTGCTLLVDLNNLHVNQLNHGHDAWSLLRGLPSASISQWHLGGPTEVDGAWIDTHASTVPEAVWSLYDMAIDTVGPRPTIVEWDQDLPPLQTLLDLAERARKALTRRSTPSCIRSNALQEQFA